MCKTSDGHLTQAIQMQISLVERLKEFSNSNNGWANWLWSWSKFLEATPQLKVGMKYLIKTSAQGLRLIRHL